MEVTDLVKMKCALQGIAFAEVAVGNLDVKAETKLDSDGAGSESATARGGASVGDSTATNSVATAPPAALSVVIPGAGMGATPKRSAIDTFTLTAKGCNVQVAHARMGSVKSDHSVDTSKSGARR
jgi:hypothetical protein